MTQTTRLAAVSPPILVALAVDVLTPFLIWKGLIPPATRWLSHAALVAIMGLAAYRMTRSDWVPTSLLYIVGLAAIGSSVALLHGQGLLATAWGCWTLFVYPMVGVYCYLQPRWPARFGGLLFGLCATVLGAAFAVQLIQFATGARAVDNLAGLFGQNGTARFALFALFTLSLAFGRWLVDDRLAPVLLVGGLALAASVVGEMKILPFCAFLISGLAGAAYLYLHRRVRRLLLLGSFAVIGGSLFLVAYDAIVPGEPFRQFLTAEGLSRYLNLEPTRYQVGGEYGYSQGRNATLVNAWNIIREEPATLLLGTGIGSGRESRSLETGGAGLTKGMFRMIPSSDLAAIVLELGLFGLLVASGATGWVVFGLWRDAQRSRDPDLLGLRLGLLLFSVMWPVWLWYTTVSGFRITLLLYFTGLGYVFRASRAGL